MTSIGGTFRVTMYTNKIENFNYLNVAFISYKLYHVELNAVVLREGLQVRLEEFVNFSCILN